MFFNAEYQPAQCRVAIGWAMLITTVKNISALVSACPGCRVCFWFKALILVMALGLLSPTVPVSHASATDDSIVRASGDGFTVTQSYLEALAAFYRIGGGFEAEPSGYLDTAVRIKILALEAERLQLAPLELEVAERVVEQSDDLPSGLPMSQVLEDVALADALSTHVVSAYPIDDLVIRSYYHSYPNRFQGPDGLLSLDDGLRASIRATILDGFKNRIMEQHYAEIREQYAVQIK